MEAVQGQNWQRIEFINVDHACSYIVNFVFFLPADWVVDRHFFHFVFVIFYFFFTFFFSYLTQNSTYITLTCSSSNSSNSSKKNAPATKQRRQNEFAIWISNMFFLNLRLCNAMTKNSFYKMNSVLGPNSIS